MFITQVIAEELDEFYVFLCLLNRATGRNMVMYSTEGGMDIETGC